MGSRLTLLRPGLTSYQPAWELQRRVADAVRDGADATLILLEHPPTYTLGSRGKAEHLLLSEEAFLRRGAAVHRTDRGGDVTYHGPGQIVGYPILDLRALGLGPVAYVRALESVLIDVLSRFGIVAERSDRNHGVWVGDAKIAAIGVRVSRGVTTHGFALNVNTDLSYFRDIVPCGMPDAGVTSMQRLTGETFAMREVEDAIIDAFAVEFGFEPERDARRGRSARATVDVVSGHPETVGDTVNTVGLAGTVRGQTDTLRGEAERGLNARATGREPERETQRGLKAPATGHRSADAGAAPGETVRRISDAAGDVRRSLAGADATVAGVADGR